MKNYVYTLIAFISLSAGVASAQIEGENLKIYTMKIECLDEAAKAVECQVDDNGDIISRGKFKKATITYRDESDNLRFKIEGVQNSGLFVRHVDTVTKYDRSGNVVYTKTIKARSWKHLDKKMGRKVGKDGKHGLLED